MSNKPPPLGFNRPLSAVRLGTRDSETAQPKRVATVEEMQVAERLRQLEQQSRELTHREDELARREAELADKESAVEQTLERLAALIGSVRAEKVDLLKANEEEIVSFSLSITEKVLQYEIENGRYKMAEVVRSALRAVRDKGAVAVRVNPRDYELAKAAVQKLERTFGTTRINTVPDEAIPLAACCIETDSGKIFSEIPGRLKAIERSLLRKNGEPNGL